VPVPYLQIDISIWSDVQIETKMMWRLSETEKRRQF